MLTDDEKRALFEAIYAEEGESVISTACEFSIDAGKYVPSNKTNMPEQVISLAVGVKNTCYNFFIKGWDVSKEHNTGVPEGYVLLPKTPTVLTDDVLGLMGQFQKTRTFKRFYSTLLRFNEELDCFVATEKWRDKEAELLTSAWWMFSEVERTQAVPEGFVLVPKEPTEAMLYAGYESKTKTENLKINYRAMVEAQE